ncbi:cytochrome c biogenesis family protein [Rhodobacteraceae bacterium HTCC2150]|nr:cytochrome c biogenesis family protein [Rhodobacteraceae bacterium HTCC2150]
MRLFLIISMVVLLPFAALSVEPDEILDDPALEARARVLSKELRCPQCQNESIDESNASIARDLRIVLRERLVAGDDDQQAVAFLVDRYGEFVLLKPTKTGANLALWIAGPVMLFLAVLTAALYARRRRNATVIPALSSDEEKRLADILDE